jgi:CHAD domain-containing protein
VVESWSEPLRAELRWLGSGLGPVRDLDVLLEHLRPEIEALGADEAAAPILAALEEEHEQARATLLAELRSRRYLDLLGSLESAALSPVLRAEQEPLAAIAGREFARLKKTMKAITPKSKDAKLHRARIRGKRARYAAELAEASVGKPATRFVERAKHFQDVIGEHQDATVAEERIRALADRLPPDAVLAGGRLIERERERRAAARAALPKAWRKLRKAGERAFE